MTYSVHFNPTKYGDLLPFLEKAIMLSPGGKLKFRVTKGSIRTAAYKCREYFNLNPEVGYREFAVREGPNVEALDNDVIEIERKDVSNHGIEAIEEL